MTKVTEAVYSSGVLKPTEDLGLREDQSVRLIVEGWNCEHAVLLIGNAALP